MVSFQASKIWMFFKKIYCVASWKLFSGRNNSLEPSGFGFSKSLSYDLEISREPWLVGFWVSRCWKMQNTSANKVFLCIFEPPLWICNIPWNIKFSSFCHTESSFNRQNLTYCNILANSYQILRWIMSKFASRDVLGKIILFALEFSSLKGWNLGLYQIIPILKNDNYT